MEQAPRPDRPGRPAAGLFRTDYALWALCSAAILAGFGLVPYEGRPSSLWNELAGAVQGEHWADVPRLAVAGLVAVTLAALLGWAVQAVLADHCGTGVGRRPAKPDGHDDKPPTR